MHSIHSTLPTCILLVWKLMCHDNKARSLIQGSHLWCRMMCAVTQDDVSDDGPLTQNYVSSDDGSNDVSDDAG